MEDSGSVGPGRRYKKVGSRKIRGLVVALGALGFVCVAAVYVIEPSLGWSWLRDPTAVDGFSWVANAVLIGSAYFALCGVTDVWWGPTGYLSPIDEPEPEVDVRELLAGGGPSLAGSDRVPQSADAGGGGAEVLGRQLSVALSTRGDRGGKMSFNDLQPVAIDERFLNALELSRTLPDDVTEFMDRAKDAKSVSGPEAWYRWLELNVPDKVMEVSAATWNERTSGSSFSEHVVAVCRNGSGKGNWKWVFILEEVIRATGDRLGVRIDVSTGGRPPQS